MSVVVNSTRRSFTLKKKVRRRLLYLLIPLLLLNALALWLKHEVTRIDAEAEKFAETGKEVIGLLGDYQAAVGKLNLDGVLACYDANYASEREGFWIER